MLRKWKECFEESMNEENEKERMLEAVNNWNRKLESLVKMK